MAMTLVIGNKNYSTWSLRPWLLMSAFNLDFKEELESLNGTDLSDRLEKHSPSARVPVLIDDENAIWDSLAICEYLNDTHLSNQAWPTEVKSKSRARAIACEMHSGFGAIRSALPMNIRANRKVVLDDAIKKDIKRIDDIWSDHDESGWLFDSFGIVDCFYAPVALRFITYNIELSDAASQYHQKLLNHPALKQWIAAALLEAEIIDSEEVGSPVEA